MKEGEGEKGGGRHGERRKGGKGGRIGMTEGDREGRGERR